MVFQRDAVCDEAEDRDGQTRNEGAESVDRYIDGFHDQVLLRRVKKIASGSSASKGIYVFAF